MVEGSVVGRRECLSHKVSFEQRSERNEATAK